MVPGSGQHQGNKEQVSGKICKGAGRLWQAEQAKINRGPAKKRSGGGDEVVVQVWGADDLPQLDAENLPEARTAQLRWNLWGRIRNNFTPAMVRGSD